MVEHIVCLQLLDIALCAKYLYNTCIGCIVVEVAHNHNLGVRVCGAYRVADVLTLLGYEVARILRTLLTAKS